MSRVGDFVVGAVAGSAVTLGSMNYHLVRADDGFHVVRKLTTGFTDPYVDIRNFTPQQWNEHRMLAAAILRADKGDLIADQSISSFRRGIEDWVSGLEGAK